MKPVWNVNSGKYLKPTLADILWGVDLSQGAVVVQLHPLQGAGEGRDLPSPPGAPGQSSQSLRCENVKFLLSWLSLRARVRTVRWFRRMQAEVDYLVYASLHAPLPWSKNYEKMESKNDWVCTDTRPGCSTVLSMCNVYAFYGWTRIPLLLMMLLWR